ncbi:pyridoxal phosphate-dependent aminotransferase [Candidatus Bathycorpusculum sp.]|uniref:pyridoxal phosphate-dependent aminotransferase n=1 Tax=Candidatus Bathycorpusculum sp. TaxID=2994959 RepID=UPI00281C403F|nr:pyridoxal phosphate-dependent aminotransferase [Candidatus Termitimicrobium sp.]MCL2432279.1 pyridoxal phosphate-dependent aminotransferase [Candidatus Termitimicrobium sp.]
MLYEINEKALKLESEGKKIIRLNLGDPDMATPPEIVEASYASMKAGKTKYASSYGEMRLRQKIAEIHGVKAENIVITPGSKWGIFASMFLMLKNGGNVIIPTPYWTAYDLIAKTLGVKTKLLRTEMENDWKVDPNQLENLIDADTKMIILNNPNNPTSKAMDTKTLDGIVEVANKKGITVLSDEVYGAISFNPTKSILDYGTDSPHILSNGFSKTFTMTGWRIGYLIANKLFIDNITKLNQITINNVPVFIQDAALKGLELQAQIAGNIKAKYKQRADLASKKLSAAGFKFTQPDAPFYVFPKRDGLDGEKFTLNLLDRGVAVAPGTSFGDYREHFRISLTAPDDQIETALDKICEVTN